MVHWLVLVDLYTGADVAVAVQEEGEGAGKMLTVNKKGQRRELICHSLERTIKNAQYGENELRGKKQADPILISAVPSM